MEKDANWQFTPDESAGSPGPQEGVAPKPQTEVEWTASEFVAHQKSFGWYLALTGLGLAAAAIIYLVTRDVISAGIILLAAFMLGTFAGRRPRTLQYRLTNSRAHIGTKQYPYSDFKSFYVVAEGPLSSITLVPLKRFMLPITIYYDPKDTRVIDTLSSYLPLEENEHDAIDRLMRRVRF